MSEEKDIEPTISRIIESQCESDRNLYLKDKIKSLESRLEEQEKRAFEYHAEWESACLRERGRIEDVKDLESRLKAVEEAKNAMLILTESRYARIDKLESELEDAESRLNEAEALQKKITHGTVSLCENCQSLEQRLSKVMDVAEKLGMVLVQLWGAKEWNPWMFETVKPLLASLDVIKGEFEEGVK